MKRVFKRLSKLAAVVALIATGCASNYFGRFELESGVSDGCSTPALLAIARETSERFKLRSVRDIGHSDLLFQAWSRPSSHPSIAVSLSRELDNNDSAITIVAIGSGPTQLTTEIAVDLSERLVRAFPECNFRFVQGSAHGSLMAP